MRIALSQIVATADPAENLGLVANGAQRAAEAGAALVVFPEATMCAFGKYRKDIQKPKLRPILFAIKWGESLYEPARRNAA